MSQTRPEGKALAVVPKILLFPGRRGSEGGLTAESLSAAGLECELILRRGALPPVGSGRKSWDLALLGCEGLADGEVLERLAEAEAACPGVPALVYGPGAGGTDVAAWIRAGASDYDPGTDPAALVRRIEEALERARFRSADISLPGEHDSRTFRYSPVSLWEEDISELRAALDRLKESGVNDVRAFLEANPDFIRRAAGMIKVLDVNQATLELFGASSREKFIGPLDACLDITPILGQLREEIVAIAEGRTFLEGETVSSRLDGSRIEIYVRVAISPPTAARSRMQVSIMDITPLKNAERELRVERARLQHKLRNEVLLGGVASRLNNPGAFQDTLDAVLGQIGETTGVDRVCFFRLNGSSTAERMNCWEKAIPKCATCFGSFDEFQPEPEFMSQIRSDQFYRFCAPEELNPADRKYFLDQGCRAGLICPVGTGGEGLGYLCLFSFKECRWEEEEIGLCRTVADMLANAWERERQFKGRLDAEHVQVEAVRMAEKTSRLASLGALAAGVAHEINQPLTALKVKVDSSLYWLELDQELSREKYSETLGFVSAQAGRIDQIVRHMRSLLRQDTSREPVSVDINQVVRSALSLVDEQLRSHAIRLHTDFADGLPAITSQPALIEQVVINLAGNAMTRLEGQAGSDKDVWISTGLEDSGRWVHVRDNGPAVPPELLDHMFDPFFSLKLGFGHVGLSLSITENIVSGLGGVITVRNDSGGGCVFEVRLPEVI